MLGQRGCVLWFTGLSGSGKSTVACTIEHELARRGTLTALLDGDNIRHGLNKVKSASRAHERVSFAQDCVESPHYARGFVALQEHARGICT